MSSQALEHRPASILSMKIAVEQDIVTARQRARQIASLLSFGSQDQVRIATAVSEIARNVHQYAGGGTLEFSVDLHSRPQVFWMFLTDAGPGMPNLQAVLSGQYESQTGMGVGLTGTRRLMDHFAIESEPGQRTTVSFGKRLPPDAGPLTHAVIGVLRNQLAKQSASGALEELQRQNRAVITSEELPILPGDEQQLAQVFQNLLSNALKYRNSSEPVRIHVGVRRSGPEWIVSVRDNGIGFEQQYADRIFGLFKRLHVGEYAGTGLGLAICKRIIERHEGRIWAESEPGTGSTFYFAVPG